MNIQYQTPGQVKVFANSESEAHEVLATAIDEMLIKSNKIDTRQPDGFKLLGDELASICQNYEQKVDKTQWTILNEQRTRLLINAMLGESC